MKLILAHPTGNTFVRALANQLREANMLHAFYTTIAFFPGPLKDKLARYEVFAELNRRGYDLALKKYTKTLSFWEMGRIASAKIGARSLIRHETGFFSVDKVYRTFDNFVAKHMKNAGGKGYEAVYAYEDGAIATFLSAKANGIKCIYDLPIAYWETGKKLLAEEALRLPEWEKTLGGGISDSPKKLQRKTRELELADAVITPSQFVVDSLPEWAKSKNIIKAPFGTPLNLYTSYSLEEKRNLNRPLRIMFAGSMSQRKGLGDLFSAIKLLNNANIELIVMGSLLTSMDFYKSQLSQFTYEKGRPHAQVLELMQTCDVLCLPSIVEGRALVMQEAMSNGLPIIITPNTGGEDLIIEGETGFLVPIRSPEIIAEKINWFAENRAKIAGMGRQAKQHAENYTWENYGKQIINSINNLFE